SRDSRESASPGGRATSRASQASAVAVFDAAWVPIDANNGLRPRPTIALLPQHVADVVSVSLTRAASPRKPRIALALARGRQRASSRGNDVPVVILLRSRIDSEMCRQRARRKAQGRVRRDREKRLCFGHFRRKDRFPSGLESYLLACAHFAPLRRAIHHGGQSDDTNECQGQPSRYAQAIGGKGGGRSWTPEKRGRGDPRRPREPDHQASQERRADPNCGFWHLAGQATRGPHGAKPRDRRSHQDQSEQEDRIPAGQALEDGGLTAGADTRDLPRRPPPAGASFVGATAPISRTGMIRSAANTGVLDPIGMTRRGD